MGMGWRHMLELVDVHTYYGSSHILQGVSLTAREGEVVAVLGRNGVGKSTAIASVAGWVIPRRGHIRFRGQDITRLPPHRRAALGLGLVPQGRRIFPNLTVRENLTVAHRRRHGRWDLAAIYRLFPRLQEREGFRGSQLSGGEQSMLSLARALMTNPDLLILDEPSEGLSPKVTQEVGQILLTLKREGCPILLVEQNLPLALALADRIYIMAKGQVVWEGTPAQLRGSPEVMHRYLGI